MGQSEPAPMTAPVGGSVHRMNMGWMDRWMDDSPLHLTLTNILSHSIFFGC